MKNNNAHTVKPFSLERILVQDATFIGKKIPHVHSILQADVTEVRQKIKELRKREKKSLSLSAYILYCYVATLNELKNIQAYNSYRNQLFLFEDVDIFFPLEIENKVVLPKIIRSVNRLKIFEIEHEIKSAKSSTHVKLDSKQIFFLKLPRWIRHAYYNYIVKRPIKRKMFFGTAYFSAAGTYTSELTWAIPLHLHTIGMYLCNVEKKQIVKENGFEEREILAFTITADHTIIDGADMARFIIKLKHNIKHLIHNL